MLSNLAARTNLNPAMNSSSMTSYSMSQSPTDILQTETSGILMCVIRTLSQATSDNEQRDREKAKLDHEYKKSDSQLDRLIHERSSELNHSMELFRSASSKISISRDKIQSIKVSLLHCKMMLHFKRDELKKLYMEGMEHKYILELLDKIEELKNAPTVVTEHMENKEYLEATRTLVSSMQELATSLQDVEALKEIKHTLESKKEQVQETVVQDLNKHLHLHMAKSNLQEIKIDLLKDNNKKDKLAEIKNAERIFLEVTSLLRKGNYIGSSAPSRGHSRKGSASGIKVDDDVLFGGRVSPIPGGVMVADHTSRTISNMVECLALLQCIPESIEKIESGIKGELMIIIGRTTKRVLDLYSSYMKSCDQYKHVKFGDRSRVVKDKRLSRNMLLVLLAAVFEQFRTVVKNHEIFLYHVNRVITDHGLTLATPYSLADVWYKVQTALELLLSDYLDINNTSSEQHQPSSAFTDSASDISAFFSRRRTPRVKKCPLFKFESSLQAMSLNNYLREQRRGSLSFAPGSGPYNVPDGYPLNDKLLVCTPDTRNLTIIYSPFIHFANEIEEALGLHMPQEHCTLFLFLNDYVRDVFLGLLHMEIANSVEGATKSLDAWKSHTDVDTMKKLGVNKPLLQSVVSVEQSVEYLGTLMLSLPYYVEHFHGMICRMLINYKDICQAAYRGIVQPEAEDKRVISATWTRDEDIATFLRSLPNWTRLQDEVTEDFVEDSPEEVKQRHKKETDILTGNLGDTLIPPHEILADPVQLKSLAQLQESMEWFSNCINRFIVDISSSDVNLGEGKKEKLQSLSMEFLDLSHTCLLVLHLEVRVHCFYYLIPLAKKGSFYVSVESSEPDHEVLKLTKDLAMIEEHLNTSLNPLKCRYIFEGLAHLISNVLINSSQYVPRINDNGIKKMCRNIYALQQCLNNLSHCQSRETGLDHARQFYELFYSTPEEVITQIMDNGPQFTELEYTKMFKLMHNSQPNLQSRLVAELTKLSEVLGETGVTV